MLEHQQPISIGAANALVWSYVSDMANWAAIMPGFRDYEVVSDADSRWTLKVGVGALVKTVHVLVHIDLWREPDRVEFSYRLEGEPVSGSGAYQATSPVPDATEVMLTVSIVGSGPMAPAWEAMARPILPRLANGFAQELKLRIESEHQAGSETAATEEIAPRDTFWRRVSLWLRRLLGRDRTLEGARARGAV